MDEGIVQPGSKELEKLSRRLHHFIRRGLNPGGKSDISLKLIFSHGMRDMTRYKDVKPIQAIDAAYISGLIDGDGTITLTKRHQNENRQLVVTISNNERQLLEYVLKVSGVGAISKKRMYQAHHKINYTYKVTNRQAYYFLKQIINYLRSHKKARAQLILDKYLKLTPRNGKYTSLMKLERENFIEDFFKITAN
jgi:hypothetical protein